MLAYFIQYVAPNFRVACRHNADWSIQKAQLIALSLKGAFAISMGRYWSSYLKTFFRLFQDHQPRFHETSEYIRSDLERTLVRLRKDVENFKDLKVPDNVDQSL